MASKYAQHYRSAWEKNPDYKDWLRPVKGDTTRAYCLYCKSDMYAKLSDLKKHLLSQKHRKCSSPFSSSDFRQGELTFKPETQVNAMKAAEAGICLFIAEHCSLLSCNHLSELCKKKFGDSKAAYDIQLHRTKCREIITNVLAPHFVTSLIEDIGENSYSLILDESTDISVVKILGVCIRYFSLNTKTIMSSFLGLVEIESGTAESIASALKKLLHDLKLKPENLIGIGVDNASVNIGINNGVYEQLKRDLNLEHLILIRCVCHSLQLAISHASIDTLPRNIDFMLRETYNWFSRSTKCQIAYANLYKALNSGKDPLKIPAVCDTRWLSIEPAVSRILNQWDTLKLHFELARGQENCYSAEMLYNMFSDPVNKLYLLYLKPILQEFQGTMKAFEGEKTDPTKLLQDLTNLLESTSRRILLPTARVDILTENIASYVDPNPYMGYEFEKFIKSSRLNPEMEANVRRRCINFTIKLSEELQNRLPSNIHILKKMSMFSVSEVLKQVKDSVVELAEVFDYKPNVIDSIVSQWRNINFIMAPY